MTLLCLLHLTEQAGADLGRKGFKFLSVGLSPSWHNPENNGNKTPWKIVFFLIQNGTSPPRLLTSKCSPCHFVTSLHHHQTASYTGHDPEVIAGTRAWDGNSFGGAPQWGTEEITRLEWRRALTERCRHTSDAEKVALVQLAFPRGSPASIKAQVAQATREAGNQAEDPNVISSKEAGGPWATQMTSRCFSSGTRRKCSHQPASEDSWRGATDKGRCRTRFAHES